MVQNEQKSRYDDVRNVIHRELGKRLNMVDTKWYMYNSESVQEQENRKILRDFEIENGSFDSDQKSRHSIKKQEVQNLSTIVFWHSIKPASKKVKLVIIVEGD